MTRHARDAAPRPDWLWPVLALVGAAAGLLVALGALGGTGSGLAAPEAVTPSVSPTPTPTTPAPTPVPDPDATFTIVATGDVLPHLPVLASARAADGSYDFAPVLAGLDPWVQGADLALCHFEVPVAPPGVRPSGYPMFGAPAEIAAALAAQGWDGCSTASNHSVDKGFAGVTATLDALDAAGLGHVGTARSAAEQAQPQLYTLERAGQPITVAHLAATYGTNGMPVDADKPWSVDLIDTDALVAQATAARSAGADLVVVSVHCCVEYVTQPTAEQVAIDQRLADSGVVDLVLGHHAHVPQPVVQLVGGPRGEGMWVAYGLGNFLSNQDSECCSPSSDSGLLLTATVTSAGAFGAEGRAAGPVRVSHVEWTPVTVDRRGRHALHALVDIQDGTATITAADAAARTARVESAAGTEAPERTVPATVTGSAPVVVPRTIA